MSATDDERCREELSEHGYPTITAYLEADHRRLDRSFEQACDARRLGASDEAAAHLEQFRKGLARHIALEENIVFPLFLERTGIVGPVEVMRREHHRLKQLVDRAVEALPGDKAVFFELATTLRDLLATHNRKEELILYPRTDAVLDEKERASLARRLEAA